MSGELFPPVSKNPFKIMFKLQTASGVIKVANKNDIIFYIFAARFVLRLLVET